MGKKKKSSSSSSGGVEQQQQQQQADKRAQRPAPQSGSDSDSDASPAPVAPASSKSKSASKRRTGHSSGSGSGSSDALHANSLPEPFGAIGTPHPDDFTLQPDPRKPHYPARVPDRAYLEPTLPVGSWARTFRNLYWKWRIHSVAPFFDPLEIVVLNVGAGLVGVAALTYVASSVAGMFM